MSRRVEGSSSTRSIFRRSGVDSGEAPPCSVLQSSRDSGVGIVFRVTRNVVPRPLPGLSTTSVPPWASTIPLQIARPSPSPPNLRVIVVSPCWNGSKMSGRISGLDADAGVGDLDDDAPIVVRVERPDGDRPALGRELDGVLDQVPEDLLEPGRVGVGPVLARRQVEHQSMSSALDLALADLDGPTDQVVAVGDAPVQRHLAPDDSASRRAGRRSAGPGEVHVLADHAQRRGQLLRRHRPFQHRGDRQQDRVERRA